MNAGSLLAGIGVAGAAAVCTAASVGLQSFEARQVEGRRHLIARLAHRPKWLLGTVLNIAVWPLSVVALTLAPITIVQPMLSTSLLLLLVIGATRLGERVGPREIGAALCIAGGIAGIVLAAPRGSVSHASELRIGIALAIVGVAAIAGCARAWRPRSAALAGVVGCGLAYAWTDFANKLVAGNSANGAWGAVAGWVAGILLMGAMAFFAEQRALQRSPATRVAPIISAVKVSIPVLIALGAGAERRGSVPQFAAIVGCLAVVALGAEMLARSPAVGRLMGGGEGERRAPRAASDAGAGSRLASDEASPSGARA